MGGKILFLTERVKSSRNQSDDKSEENSYLYVKSIIDLISYTGYADYTTYKGFRLYFQIQENNICP
jgi:hypothetical protein